MRGIHHLTTRMATSPLADGVSTDYLNTWLKHDGVQTLVALAALVIIMAGIRAHMTKVITVGFLVFIGMAFVVMSGNQHMQDATGGFVLHLLGIS